MCILIVKNKGLKSPPTEHFRNSWESNDDGVGVAWTKGDGFVSFKKFLEYKDFNRFISKEAPFVGFEQNYSIMYHFRMATQGSIKLHNVHPFVVSEKLYDIKRTEGKAPMMMAHNGVISGLYDVADISDTMIFVRDILSKPYIKNNIGEPAVRNLLSKYLIGSKIAVLDGRGVFTVINQSSGVFEGGVWYSNTGYKGWDSVYSQYEDTDWYKKYYNKDYSHQNEPKKLPSPPSSFVDSYEYNDDSTKCSFNYGRQKTSSHSHYYSSYKECAYCMTKSPHLYTIDSGAELCANCWHDYENTDDLGKEFMNDTILSWKEEYTPVK